MTRVIAISLFVLMFFPFIQLSSASAETSSVADSPVPVQDVAVALTADKPYPVWWGERMVDKYKAVKPEFKIWHGTTSPQTVSLSTGQRNAVVSLMMQSWGGYQSFCTGTLISDRVVVSAAHCVHQCDDYGNNCQDISASYTAIGVGDDLSSATAVLGVSNIYYNPSYTGDLTITTAYHDVSILVLSQSASAQVSTLTPIPFNRDPISSSFVNTDVQAGGYGITESTNYNTRKYWATLGLSAIRAYEIVAADSAGVQGVCSGDSGGPLMADFGAGLTVFATTSWGTEDCTEPAHFCRLDPKSDWIEAILSQTNDCSSACSGQQCGYDGSCHCGSCGSGDLCNSQHQCVPDPDNHCGSVPEIGCCDGSMAMKCVSGQLVEDECGDLGCGWKNQYSGYACGNAGKVDPDGNYSWGCDGSEPSCDIICHDRQCGDYEGCNCGECLHGLVCEDNYCEIPPSCREVCGSRRECGEYENCVCGQCDDDEMCQEFRCMDDPSADGDDPDGDSPVDGDEPVNCDGACAPIDTPFCLDTGRLCECRQLAWGATDCNLYCIEQGMANAGCSFHPGLQKDVCLCRELDPDPTDGDTPDNSDGDDTDDEPKGFGVDSGSGCQGSNGVSALALMILMLFVGLKRQRRKN